MNAPLTYRDLQAALKELKANGADVRCKLTAKADVLQAEYTRLTATKCNEVEIATVVNEFDEDANGNWVNPELSVPDDTILKPTPITNLVDDIAGNKRAKPLTKDVNTNSRLHAANNKAASMNASPRHTSKVSNARKPTLIVNTAANAPKVKCEYSKTPKSEYFVDVNHTRYESVNRYVQELGTTEKQALSNVIEFGRAVVNIAKGFHNRQVERYAA